MVPLPPFFKLGHYPRRRAPRDPDGCVSVVKVQDPKKLDLAQIGDVGNFRRGHFV